MRGGRKLESEIADARQIKSCDQSEAIVAGYAFPLRNVSTLNLRQIEKEES